MNRDAEIYRLRTKGAKIADLAARFNLSKARVSVICKTQAGLLAAGADMPARMEAARLELLKWRAIDEEYKATLSELRGRRLTGELISRDEVRDMFTRVFSSFRQAIREMDRRYGPEAAEFLIAAERGALSTAQVGIPKAEKEREEKTVREQTDPALNSKHPERKARATASKTNAGAVVKQRSF